MTPGAGNVEKEQIASSSTVDREPRDEEDNLVGEVGYQLDVH